ncbi:GAF domain-containing protein, partial [Holdemanella porci]
RIPYGKGVVGTCAKTQETQRIEDVHQFPGHIACDCASNSEICIPIKKDDKLVAILDIDSYKFNNFSKEDQATLEKICEFFIPLF